MSKSVLELAVGTGQWDAGLKKARSAMDKFVEAQGGVQQALSKSGGKMQTFVQMMGKMESTAKTSKGKMADYRGAIEQLTLQYNKLSASQQKAFGGTYTQAIDQLKTKFAAARAEAESLNKSLGVMNATNTGNAFTRGLGSAFSMFGPAALATTGVMAAVGGLKKVMSDVVNINMQFEQSTAVLASIMGKTTGEISDLTAQAKQLGAATRYTAMQITELQTNLARLGFTSQEILNSTTAVQALATATGADLGEAANLAGAALRGFGLNAAEMERVASVLSVSTTKSALSFEKLATAVPIVAPVAKQFGFTIEDTVTLLAKLSDAGMDASSAATATRNIFLRMANESGKLATALGRPVHSVEEFGEALKEMHERGMSLSDILNMVGVRSTAAFAVFADNADTLEDFKQSITDCSEAMHDMESKQLNTLQGSVTIMKSAWEGLMLTFSDSNGILKSTTDALTRLLQAWTNWRKRQQGGEGAIGTYEKGVTSEDKQRMDALYKAYRAGGTADEEIADKATTAADALIAERDAAKSLYEQMVALRRESADKYMQQLPGLNEQAKAIIPGMKDYDTDYMARYIAGLNDKIAAQQYLASLATPSVAPAAAPSGSADESPNTAKLRAQYEAEEKAQIAALDRMAMQEEEYEAKVYEIRRAAMEKIAALYNEDTAEHARALARISQLEIEYQGKQMRFATRRDKSDDRTLASILGTPERDTRVTEGNISALSQKFQKELSNAFVGSEDYLIAADKIADLNAFQNLLKQAVAAGAEFNPAQMQMLFDNIRLGVEVSDDSWNEMVAEINEKLATLNLPPIELDVKTGGVKKVKADVDSMKTSWTAAASAVAQVGSAMQSIDDPTAKIAGIVAEAIASVAAGLGQMLSQPQATSEAWGWVALAISGTATMISTIAAIKNATKFEHGGVVPGTSYTGDKIVARLNSGEGVLTRQGIDNAGRMMSSLAIGGGGGSAMGGTPYVTGEMILLGANNYLGRSGQGEIVTTSMLRRAGINL